MRTLLAADEPEPAPTGPSFSYWPGTTNSVAAGYAPTYVLNITVGAAPQPAAAPSDPYRTTAFVGRPVPEITA